jgi:hypothetical protein
MRRFRIIITDNGFFCPQVNVGRLFWPKWKTIHGSNYGNFIINAFIVDGLDGWKDKSMAEKTIEYYRLFVKNKK